MTTTFLKLAFGGIRSRRLASGLTVLIASAAAAAIVLALEVGATGRDPWQRTFDAAHRPRLGARRFAGRGAQDRDAPRRRRAR
jgi:hypothetical protein